MTPTGSSPPPQRGNGPQERKSAQLVQAVPAEDQAVVMGVCGIGAALCRGALGAAQ
jgi:hypothetical protein